MYLQQGLEVLPIENVGQNQLFEIWEDVFADGHKVTNGPLWK